MLDSLDALIAFALIFTIVSLLITIVVQMVTSLTNLRGKNLSWGVAEAFEAIAPDLKAEADGAGKKLADHLLEDYLLSDSQFGPWRGRATAVRPDELFAVLHQIAIGKKQGTPPDIQKNVTDLFQALGVDPSVFELVEAEKKRLEDLKVDLTKQLAVLPDGPVKEQLLKVKAETEASLTNAAVSAEVAATRWANQGEAVIKKLYEKFEHWFETGQERSQEWFTTHARIITAFLGVLAAFYLQLDTVEIFKLVSSNREVRTSLVAQTKTVIDQGEKILKDSPSVMQKSLDSLRSAPTNTVSGSNQSPALLKDIPILPSDSSERVKAKIREAYTNRPPAEVEKILTDFDDASLKEVRVRLNDAKGEWNTLSKSLDKTGFELFPSGGSRWKNEPGDGCAIFCRHLLGMLFSALLLSLGAPFWFNTLKSLASMRSSVAKNISAEDLAEQKDPKTDKSRKPPPTAS